MSLKNEPVSIWQMQSSGKSIRPIKFLLGFGVSIAYLFQAF